MGKTGSLAEGWFERRGQGTRDLYALGLLAITERGYRPLVVPGIITVLLVASFAEGGWFKKRQMAPARRGGYAPGASRRGCDPCRFR